MHLSTFLGFCFLVSHAQDFQREHGDHQGSDLRFVGGLLMTSCPCRSHG
jgi:hypothetical protein